MLMKLVDIFQGDFDEWKPYAKDNIGDTFLAVIRSDQWDWVGLLRNSLLFFPFFSIT